MPRRPAPDLRFFEELRVRDPALSPKGIETVYRFTPKRGKAKEIPLAYRFDRPVVANTPRLRNLARVLVSIPALNYGLFCERILLDYAVAREDVEYFRAMLDVTAREQYLTRFVADEPHPLLLPRFHVPPADFDPRAVRRLARIECDREPLPDPAAQAPDRDRFGVLSSGGKESLLTYGVLRELGKEVHPIYFNESGRHWHTAVTAYRLHARTDPRTRRVWSSTDRLYTAVNRLLPCVRPDFQRVRADVYPIQLFTFNNYQVASLFFCLAEGIGTLLMGNEFDEGPWPERKGVRFYHGIYDQSQEFDRLVSGYYASKGWAVRQTSLVRPLSSLVIEDTLVTRYPDLARAQTSCHATHVKAGEVRPCGRCSKCLGVLLFLLANGHDPRLLRYAAADVEALADRVARVRLKVDPCEAEHALAKLADRGWAFAGSANGFEPRKHPEVERMRFHPETCARGDLPPALAREVYGVFLKHAPGAVEKRGNRWVTVPDADLAAG